MPLDYKRDDANRRVRLTVSELFDLADLIAAVERQLGDGAWGHGLLIDARAPLTVSPTNDIQSVRGTCQRVDRRAWPPRADRRDLEGREDDPGASRSMPCSLGRTRRSNCSGIWTTVRNGLTHGWLKAAKRQKWAVEPEAISTNLLGALEGQTMFAEGRNLIAIGVGGVVVLVAAVWGVCHYPSGVAVTDAQMATVRLERHRFHGDWKYTIYPAIYVLTDGDDGALMRIEPADL